MRRAFFPRLGRRGIAAVEFALIVPVLLILFIGTVEILTLYRTEAKLNAIAFNVAQNVSSAISVSTSNAPLTNTIGTVTSLNDICVGAVLGLQPFPPKNLTIAIASITEEAASNGLPQTSAAYTTNKTPYYDEWESDSTVSSAGACSTPAYSATKPPATLILSGTGSSAPINIAMPPSTTSMVKYPCDNVIIVQASLTYPGITGLILKSVPILTQTAYVRWMYADPEHELLCSGCTLVYASTNQSNQQICDSANNLATN